MNPRRCQTEDDASVKDFAETRPDNTRIRTYVWGGDLSGSMQGAGGVGGLLEVSYYGSATTNCFVAYDGNGNVAGLINAADGTFVANYEYGPFGEPIRITGAMANNSPFLFSTKYYDSEPGLYYYGYRFYNPSTGTWPDRDPVQEMAFQKVTLIHLVSKEMAERLIKDSIACLYQFVHNDSLDLLDQFGLDVTWNGSGACPTGQTVTFAQVEWGGYSIWGLKKPRVDNGSYPFGLGSENTGCLEYPGNAKNGYTGFFNDTPSPRGGPDQFVTCLLCTKPCCIKNASGHYLVHIGQCRKWKNGDSGDLSTFPSPSVADMKIFNDTMSAQYPWEMIGRCYKCNRQ